MSISMPFFFRRGRGAKLSRSERIPLAGSNGLVLTVADPGFSRGGGREPSRGGREHAKFSRKLHEIERIWTPRGGACVPHAPP